MRTLKSLYGVILETVMAEKVETILQQGHNLPPDRRDFYDVYILGNTQKYDKRIFREALNATAIHRGSLEKIADRNKIIDHISADEDLKNMWKKYQKKFSYANDISYEQVIALLREVVLEE